MFSFNSPYPMVGMKVTCRIQNLWLLKGERLQSKLVRLETLQSAFCDGQLACLLIVA